MRSGLLVLSALLVFSQLAFAAPQSTAKRDAIRATVSDLRRQHPELARAPETPVQTDGTLEVTITDNFSAGETLLSHVLVTPAGERLNLHFSGDAPKLKHGMKLRVRGHRVDRHVVLSPETPESGAPDDAGLWLLTEDMTGLAPQALTDEAAATAALVTHKVAVILYHWASQTPPWTVAFARGTAFTDPFSVRNYFREVSYGQMDLTGYLSPASGDVFGWYVLPGSPPGCGSTGAPDASALAAADGFVESNYTNVIYAFAGTSCGWVGMAEVFGRRVWINHGNFDLGVVAHELGHNLGFGHAGSRSCTSGGVPVTLGPTCTTSEYGDPFDVMGGAWAHRHHKPENKQRKSWLTAANAQTITADGTYPLAPHELASAGAMMLTVGEVGQPAFTVEFRQPYGLFDNFPPVDPAVNGVMIRNGYLLDMTPGSAGNFNDAALPVGQAFTDPATGLRIRTQSVSASGAGVAVTFGPCQRKIPAMSVSPSFHTAPPGGTPRTYSIGAQNLDFTKCGSSSMTVTPTLPGPGWTSSPSMGIGSLAPGASQMWDFTITPPASAPEGLYAIDFLARNTVSGLTYTATVEFEIKVPDLTPPALVAIAAPANGAVYTTAQLVTIRLNTSADVDRVEFFVDGMQYGARWDPPFEQFWSVDTWNNGPHVITARGYDEAGNFTDAAPVSVTVSVGAPDLTLTALSTTATSVAPGGTLPATNTARNQGGAAAGSSVTRFSLSADAVYGGANDRAISQTRAVGALAAGASSAATTTLTVPASTPPGAYYLCAAADSGGTVAEADEANNTRCTSALLQVAAVTASVTPSATTVASRGALSISFSMTGRTPTSTDWIGLFLAGSANTSTRYWWQYTGGTASGTKTLTAPATAGNYEFRLFANNTYTLLATSTVVTVSGGASAPTATLSASPLSITAGQSSTLTWSSTNATGCTASGGWTGAKAVSGSQAVSPTVTTTYSLTCAGAGGTSPVRSVTVTVSGGTGSTTVTPSALSVSAGAPLSVSFSMTGRTPTSTDWIGLYRVGDLSTGTRQWWAYTGGTASGTKTLTAPQAGGTYEFRLFASNSYTLLATSAPVTVTGVTVTASVTPSATTVTRGGALSVTFSMTGRTPTGTDWIGLFLAGSANTSTRYWWQYTGGTASGTKTLTAPATAGRYEFRLFASNSYTLLATSAAVDVP